MSASVHQRLLSKSKEKTRPFNELLQYFAMERFLYRLSKSAHSGKFILKGALMFTAWGGHSARATMDIDFLAQRIANSLQVISDAMKDACIVDVDADGMLYDPESVTVSRITEDAEYEGVRVRIKASLGNARIFLQVDIGFGDAVFPNPRRVGYPVILDMPAPELNGYTPESAIAEKYQTMIKLGILNSRMKDFYDIWLLSRIFNFSGKNLAEAIKQTFSNRYTPIVANPEIFDSVFVTDENKQIQWKSFIRKVGLSDAPELFSDVLDVLEVFLKPVVSAVADGNPFEEMWTASGSWM